MHDTSVGFVGAGVMATALACGFVKGGTLDANKIAASDLYSPALESFRGKVNLK